MAITYEIDCGDASPKKDAHEWTERLKGRGDAGETPGGNSLVILPGKDAA